MIHWLYPKSENGYEHALWVVKQFDCCFQIPFTHDCSCVYACIVVCKVSAGHVGDCVMTEKPSSC
jgi:hypothetical protein